MAHVPKNPAIALRDGVSPSCVALPRMRQPPWPTVLDFLAEHLPRIERNTWLQRMQAQQVLDQDGHPLPPHAPYQAGTRVYYWRELQAEPEIAYHEHLIYQDEHLVVADKPHFLPVTPGGRYVQQSLLVRLKKRLGLPNLSPLHRIDRETAGLVVFGIQAHERNAYQQLFRQRQVEKTYQAIAPWRPEDVWPHTRRSHILECEDAFYKMREALPTEGLPDNSITHIDCLEYLCQHPAHGALARYRLQPISGKRHQLRVHMLGLGLPIVGDQFYPQTRRAAGEPDSFEQPLLLLAQSIAFTDPITGRPRQFHSQRQLLVD